jgi:hypothetical protein
VTDNYVPGPQHRVVLAIQYYSNDEPQAMRLARLLADIETARRDDVILALCRRFDTHLSALAWQTMLHCGQRFPVMQLASEREGTGHPQGCNELAAGVLDKLAAGWQAGSLGAHSVALLEPDGCPMRRDWIDRLLAEHRTAIAEGKRVSGHRVSYPFDHVNGSLVMNLSLWLDRLSLHRTPSDHAWDLHHAAVLTSEVRHTNAIANVYGARNYSPEVLAALAKEVAWLASTKDLTALQWAERTLVDRQPEAAQSPDGRVMVQG